MEIGEIMTEDAIKKYNSMRKVLSRYDTVKEEIDKMERALELLRKNSKAITRIHISDGSINWPIEFNRELGTALYQARLDKLRSELKEIEKRMEGWK